VNAEPVKPVRRRSRKTMAPDGPLVDEGTPPPPRTRSKKSAPKAAKADTRSESDGLPVGAVDAAPFTDTLAAAFLYVPVLGASPLAFEGDLVVALYLLTLPTIGLLLIGGILLDANRINSVRDSLDKVAYLAAFEAAAELGAALAAVSTQKLPIWSITFLNPESTRLKKQLPHRHGHPWEEAHGHHEPLRTSPSSMTTPRRHA
jgi:hypothetical protein